MCEWIVDSFFFIKLGAYFQKGTFPVKSFFLNVIMFRSIVGGIQKCYQILESHMPH